MTSFKDYLRDNAKFYCPPVKCHQTAFTAVTDVEVEQVFARWDSDHTVLEAHHGAQMVDALINVLNEELGETLVPESMKGRFQRHYEDDAPGTCVIRTEPEIVDILVFSRSKVHFVLTMLRGKEGLVEIKALLVFDSAAEELFELQNGGDDGDGEAGFEVRLDYERPTGHDRYESHYEGVCVHDPANCHMYTIKAVAKGETLEEQSYTMYIVTILTWALVMDYEGNVLTRDGESLIDLHYAASIY
ncbi:uncharacterized protein FOMMEDRAFT_152221 [Fomitiporia mediterranea MF3/22]|uniref:uncharacterized protein n=1 Tax=Fomitiporia mediterranea (strain MF3/22) TaxID=694068 RepID=UPI0004408361|nr:uncharacterized protein FOMMEDRAFT_152221 [Fomitiporia mediterranea MF3/22]EJD06894.1 hypothetical protein FOMMEDRAFT_152221 [Fomitiporia mediterranea MF3/22]